jgi:hypothetical protein
MIINSYVYVTDTTFVFVFVNSDSVNIFSPIFLNSTLKSDNILLPKNY